MRGGAHMLRGILAGAFWGIVVGAVVLVAAALAIDGRRVREAAPPADPVAGRLSPVDTAAFGAAPAFWPVGAGDSAPRPFTARPTKPALPDLPWPIAPVITLVPPGPVAARAHTAGSARTPPVTASDETPRPAGEVVASNAPDVTAGEAAPEDDVARAPDPALPSQPSTIDATPVAPAPPAAEGTPEVAASPAPVVQSRVPPATALTETDVPGAPDPDLSEPAPLPGSVSQPGPHVALIGPQDETGADIPVYATLDGTGPDLAARLAAITERARRDGAVAIRVTDDPALGAALADWMAREGLKPAPPEALPMLWERAAQGA